MIENDPSKEIELYTAAGDVLAAVHRSPVPSALPYRGGEWPILTYDHLALSANADLFVEWMPKRDLEMRINRTDAPALGAGAREPDRRRSRISPAR